MTKSEYNRDQIETLGMIRRYFETLSYEEISKLKDKTYGYLRFRKIVADFQKRYLSKTCIQ